MTRLLVLAVLAPAAPVRADDKPAAAVTYDGDVRPILRKQCGSCHAAERPRGDLDLSTYAGLLQGGLSGKAVVAGNPDASPLYTMTAHLEDPKMPPNKPKIPQREIDTIRKWIEGGLVEKAGSAAATPAATAPKAAAGGLGTPTPFPRPTPVTALAVSPTAPLVAVPGTRQVLVFDLAAGKLLGALPFPEGEVHALRFSHDGTVLIAGGGVAGQSGGVVGFEVGTWKRLFAVGDETDAVLAADISPDKTRVALGGPGRVVKVVSVADGQVVHTLRKPTDWVLAVAFSPEGLLLAAGDRFGGLFVWEVKSGKEFHTLRGHTRAVTGLAWRTDSDVLASASEDGTARLWDLHAGAEVAKWDAHPEGALDVAFHPTGVLATAGRDGGVKVWDQKGKLVAAAGPAADAVLKVGFVPDGKAVVAGDWAGEVGAWPVAGGPVTKLALPVEAKPAALAVVPVPTPELPAAAEVPVKPAAPPAAAGTAVTSADLDRKRAALKAVEDAAERLKEEAARSPNNPALAKAYLQLCEAALAMKAEVLAAEAAAGGGKR